MSLLTTGVVNHRERIYFPGLNGLRFFAALVVVIHHIEQVKALEGLPNHFSLPFVHLIGSLGVTLFFVLSGFLISFLLFEEERVTGTISVRDFYIRRTLRIWPLYFLVVFLGFFVFPRFLVPAGMTPVANDFGMKLALFLLFLPNVCRVIFGSTPFVNPLWSVGVEEQFYLVWPAVVKFVRKERRLLALGAIVVGMIVLRKALAALGHLAPAGDSGAWLRTAAERLLSFFYFFRIDCMAIGGIGAYVLHTGRQTVLRVLFHRGVEIEVYAILAVCIATGRELPLGSDPVYSLLFAILILNVAANRKSLIKLEHPFLDYFGKISYGLYMYHLIVIYVVVSWLRPSVPSDSWIFQPLMAGLVFLVLGVVASVSYVFFERPFLNLKTRFSHIISGDNARQA